MWLKILDSIGLTNLTDEQVRRYYDYVHKICVSRPREERQYTTATMRALTYETLEQLKIYTIQTFASLAVFGLFLVTSICTNWLSNIWPQTGIMMTSKIIAWIISALGGLCCIASVIRSSIDFIKFLIKGPPQETSRQKVANEGRVK